MRSPLRIVCQFRVDLDSAGQVLSGTPAERLIIRFLLVNQPVKHRGYQATGDMPTTCVNGLGVVDELVQKLVNRRGSSSSVAARGRVSQDRVQCQLRVRCKTITPFVATLIKNQLCQLGFATFCRWRPSANHPRL